MNLAHHPSLQGKNASACHLTSKSKNRQTVKLTLSSSRPRSLESRYEGIQRRMTAKPPTYLFRYLAMSKSRGPKSRKRRLSCDAPSGRSFPKSPEPHQRISAASVRPVCVPAFGREVFREITKGPQAENMKKMLRPRIFCLTN